MRKTKNRKNKKDKYSFKLNAYKINYLKIIKKILEKEPSQI